MSAVVVSFPRRFTVHVSTPEEAAMFSGRRRPGDQAATIVDHREGDACFVPVALGTLIEDTDRCAWMLLKDMRSRTEPVMPDMELLF